MKSTITSRPLGRSDDFSLAKYCDPIPDVVIGVHHQNNVDELGEVGGVRAGLHRHEVAQMLSSRPLTKVTHHVRLDIGGEYFAFGNALGDPDAEISGTRADVGDAGSTFQMQGIHNLFGLLPGVTFRVVELFGPLIRIIEFTMERTVGWTTDLMAKMTAHILVSHRLF